MWPAHREERCDHLHRLEVGVGRRRRELGFPGQMVQGVQLHLEHMLSVTVAIASLDSLIS